MSTDVDTLNFSWQPGPGKTEQIQIVLRDSKDQISTWNTTSSNTTSYTKNGLIPGCLYNISIITEAAGLQNSFTIQAQTGIFFFSQGNL